MQLFWTKNAQKDILSVREYYEGRISEEILENIILGIQTTGVLLSNSPEIGRIVGEHVVRRFNVESYNYILLYKVKNNCVNILRVLDTRRKL